jgi:hypothetical protein
MQRPLTNYEIDPAELRDMLHSSDSETRTRALTRATALHGDLYEHLMDLMTVCEAFSEEHERYGAIGDALAPIIEQWDYLTSQLDIVLFDQTTLTDASTGKGATEQE